MANLNIICATIKALRHDESSDSSTSSDDEWRKQINLRKKRVLRPRVKNYALNVVARLRNDEFKQHFRINSNTFEYLLSLIHTQLKGEVKGCEMIPTSQQLMIGLWKMATMDSYRSVCDRFNVGKATGLRSVRQVTKALFLLAPKIIQWPNRNDAVLTMRKFKENSGFPNVIGAIDGTHINIDAPKHNAADYVNRKGFHSIQLQVVCDHRTYITHCYTGHPGSVHDQRVFRQSEIAEILMDEEHLLKRMAIC